MATWIDFIGVKPLQSTPVTKNRGSHGVNPAKRKISRRGLAFQVIPQMFSILKRATLKK
jgi:hypothetical protein